MEADSILKRATRRGFLRIGTASLAGLTLADVLRHEALGGGGATTRARASGVIMVWLAGGPSTIDMWDLKPDAPDEIRGDFRPIATRLEGVSICEHLPLLAGIMNRVTLVRSLTHEINDHSVGSRYLMTGNRPSTSTEFPSLGSVASRMLPGQAGVPSYVSMAEARAPGEGSGFLGDSYNPFVVKVASSGGRQRFDQLSMPEGLSLRELEDRDHLRMRLEQAFRAQDRLELPRRLDTFQQQAMDILRSDKVALRSTCPLSRRICGAIWKRPERSRGPRGAG